MFLPSCVLLTTMTVISAIHAPVIMTNSTASTVSRRERPQHTAFLPAILSVTSGGIRQKCTGNCMKCIQDCQNYVLSVHVHFENKNHQNVWGISVQNFNIISVRTRSWSLELMWHLMHETEMLNSILILTFLTLRWSCCSPPSDHHNQH